MSPTQLSQLSRRERQIMDVLIEHSQCSAHEVQKAMSEPPSYSTVRALLARLVDKGAVKYRQDGSKYIYSPQIAEEKAQQSALGRLVKTFFRGSRVKAVNALLSYDDEPLSRQEVASLERTIERLKLQQETERDDID